MRGRRASLCSVEVHLLYDVHDEGRDELQLAKNPPPVHTHTQPFHAKLSHVSLCCPSTILDVPSQDPPPHPPTHRKKRHISCCLKGHTTRDTEAMNMDEKRGHLTPPELEKPPRQKKTEENAALVRFSRVKHVEEQLIRNERKTVHTSHTRAPQQRGQAKEPVYQRGIYPHQVF